MMTIRDNIEELLKTGFSVEQIVQLTGYGVDDIKQVEVDWRKQIKQK